MRVGRVGVGVTAATARGDVKSESVMLAITEVSRAYSSALCQTGRASAPRRPPAWQVNRGSRSDCPYFIRPLIGANFDQCRTTDYGSDLRRPMRIESRVASQVSSGRPCLEPIRLSSASSTRTRNNSRSHSKISRSGPSSKTVVMPLSPKAGCPRSDCAGPPIERTAWQLRAKADGCHRDESR
jgi:hypothetical protein